MSEFLIKGVVVPGEYGLLKFAREIKKAVENSQKSILRPPLMECISEDLPYCFLGLVHDHVLLQELHAELTEELKEAPTQDDIDALEEQADSFQGQIDDLERENNDLEQTVETREGELDLLGDEKYLLQTELNNLKDSFEDLEDEKESLQNSIDTLNEDHSSLLKDYQVLEVELRLEKDRGSS